MKRIFAMVLCCVLLVTGLIVPAKADMYDQLREDMKQSFYSDEMLDVSQYQMTKEELQTIYDELYHSGELPWYADEDCSYVFGQNQYVAKFRPKVLNPKTYDRDLYEIKMAELIAETCLEGMEDWQIILNVHDYITTHVAYDESVKKNTGYDALVHGTAACYGYAQLFMDVMKRVGIPCKIAVCWDTGDGDGHAWNVVQLDGSWYHVDATWDDPVPDIYGYSNHLFFLRTDQQFLDPKWERGFGWEETEKCTDETYAKDMIWEDVHNALSFLDKDTLILRTEKKNKNYIYSIDVATGEKTELVSFKRKVLNLGKGTYLYPTAGVCVWEGRIYYNTETKVYSMLPDGTDKREEASYNAKKNKKYIYSCFVDDGVIHLELVNHGLDKFEDLNISMEGYVPHEHSFRETIVFASCTEAGRSYLGCDCGIVYKDKIIEKTDHLMLSEVVTPATTEAAGMMRHYCANCDYEEQEVLDKLPTVVEELAAEPSFWESLFGWLWT